MRIGKNGFSILVTLALVLVIPVSVQARTKNRIAVDEIPDMEYTVYSYDSFFDRIIVVFDIPNDGFRVHMYHTMFTTVGTVRPGPYIQKFQRRIKGFRTAYEILDKDGKIRGYLIASRFLLYQFLRFSDRIGVRVADDYSVR